MNTIYIKTTDEDKQIRYHSTKDKRVNLIAKCYLNYNDTGYTHDCIWKVESFLYSITELSDIYKNFGTVIDKINAYLEAKILQPDRTIPASEVGEEYEFSLDNQFPLTLEEAKEIKISEVSKRTGELLDDGFQYTGSLTRVIDSQIVTNIKFVVDFETKSNWGAILTAYSNGYITGDFECTDINGDSFIIPESDVIAFCLGMLNFVRTTKDNGRPLKRQILNCSTIEEVATIIDNR